MRLCFIIFEATCMCRHCNKHAAPQNRTNIYTIINYNSKLQAYQMLWIALVNNVVYSFRGVAARFGFGSAGAGLRCASLTQSRLYFRMRNTAHQLRKCSYDFKAKVRTSKQRSWPQSKRYDLKATFMNSKQKPWVQSKSNDFNANDCISFWFIQHLMWFL